MTQSTQINKPFGKTLEFSTTIEDGKIVGQEIVSSGPDVLVSFKIDGEHALTASDLKDLSEQILAAQFVGFALCSPDESAQYIAMSRKRFKDHIVFSKNPTAASMVWVVAELLANADHKTLYGEVAEVSLKVPTSTNVNSVSENVVSDNDEYDEDDEEWEWEGDWDEDEDDDDDEDWEEDDIAGLDHNEDSYSQLCHDESYRAQQGNNLCLKITE